MADKVIIIKNTTISDILVNGIVVPATGQSDFTNIPIAELLEDTDLFVDIASGDIVINNGTLDLSAAAGDNHIQPQQHTAHKILYTDVEGSIQEAPLGAANTLLKSAGTSIAPIWSTLQTVITDEGIVLNDLTDVNVAPTDGQVLTYNNGTGDWEANTPAGAHSIEEDDSTVVSAVSILNFEGDVSIVDEGSGKATVTIAPDLTGLLTDTPTVQATRTTDYSVTTSFANVTFDRTDIENNIPVIEHDNTNTERVTVKEAGLYYISYGFAYDYSASGTFTSRVVVNDTTEVPGSVMGVIDSNDQDESSKVCVVQLAANDYLTLQVKKSGGTASVDGTNSETTMVVYRMTGLKGDTGPAGAGSTIITKDEGTNVTNTPHSALDFVGDGVTVTDGGSGVATITIDGNPAVGELPTAQLTKTGNISVTQTDLTDVVYDTIDVENDDTVLDIDPDLTHIDILETGLYLVGYSMDVSSGANTTTLHVHIRDVGTTPDASIAGTAREYADAEYGAIAATAFISLDAGSRIEVEAKKTGAATPTIKDPSFYVMKVQGCQGAVGPTGSGSNIIVKDEGTNVTNTPHDELDFVGSGVTVTDGGSGKATITISGTPDQDLFKTIAVSGESDIVADSPTDTLTLVAGSNMTITTDAGTDTVTFAASGGASVFGNEFEEASSDTESSTTSSTWQTKLSHTTASLTNGSKYRIGYSFEVRNSDTSGEVLVDVEIDGVDVAEMRYEPQDTDNYIMQSGFYYSDTLSGATTIAIKYSQSGYGTAYIKKARIEIWRVS